MNNSDLKYSCFAYRVSAFFKPFIFEGGAPEAAPAAPSDGKKVEGAPDAARVEAQDSSARRKGLVMIEGGLSLPISTKSETGPARSEAVTRGGEVTLRLVNPGDAAKPSESYVVASLSFDLTNVSSVTYSGTSSPDTLAGRTTVTAGLGLEGNLPLGRYVTLYAGLGLGGGVQVYKHQEVTPTRSVGSGTEITLTPVISGTVGGRVNAGPVYIFVAGKPNISMANGRQLGSPIVGIGGVF